MTTMTVETKTVLEILTVMPHRLLSISKGFDDSQLHLIPNGEYWSANDILAHVRACSDVWGKSILAMVTQNHPTMRYISPRTWIRKTNYPEQEFYLSLKAYKKQRRELINALRPLKSKDWLRGATFTATTKDREPTVLSYTQRIVQHESEHFIQLEDLLKRIRK